VFLTAAIVNAAAAAVKPCAAHDASNRSGMPTRFMTASRDGKRRQRFGEL